MASDSQFTQVTVDHRLLQHETQIKALCDTTFHRGKTIPRVKVSLCMLNYDL